MGARLKTDLEIAEEALAKWPTATMGILRTGIRDDLLLPAIAAAREEGRAAGYAEAIEKAAKVAEAEYDRLYRSHRDADLPGMEAARSIENAIRALAPADKEPK